MPGLVRGGASRRLRGILQPGNTLRVNWRARLTEHLGSFTIEPHRTRAGDMMDTRESLDGVERVLGRRERRAAGA